MCSDSSQSCVATIIIIFILFTIKVEFYNNTHLYEYIIFLKHFCCNNRIVPEENDIENNNQEVTVKPDGVHS